MAEISYGQCWCGSHKGRRDPDDGTGSGIGCLTNIYHTATPGESGPALKPDWGHGPNTPVPMWTEEQIRTAMSKVMHTLGDKIKIDAVMTRLRDDQGTS